MCVQVDFWEHSRMHIKEDKVLQCPKCPFVTEYKHHLEYHLRNHFGSKPFKCGKCNYSCVNKSMLNSHMKSHTNVYQYRCSDCTYATKYCHSLKLHLKKYNHKPATVLNPDGSLPTDGSGDFELVSKRGPPRGPRGSKREKSPPMGFPSPGMMVPPPQAAGMAAAAVAAAVVGAVSGPMNGAPPSMLPPHPGCWPPTMMTSTPNSMHGPPPLIPVASIAGMNPLSIQVPHEHKGAAHLPPSIKMAMSPAYPLPAAHLAREPHDLSMKTSPVQPDGSLNLSTHTLGGRATSPQAAAISVPASHNQPPQHMRCRLCEFQAESRQVLLHHMLRIHAAENQDLFNIFGMRAEAMIAEDQKIGTEAIREAIRKTVIKCEDGRMSVKPHQEQPMRRPSTTMSPDDQPLMMFPGQIDGATKEHYNKVLAEDMLANIEAEALQNGECPLDLTKLREEAERQSKAAVDALTKHGLLDNQQVLRGKWHSPTPDATDDAAAAVVSDEVSPSPRKRSRKGKAYKLDMISMKLQERYTGSPLAGSDSQDDNEDCISDYTSDDNKAEAGDTIPAAPDMPVPTTVIAKMTNGSASGADENIDFMEIHNDLKALNSSHGSPEDNYGRDENVDTNMKTLEGVNSHKVLQVVRRLEAEYAGEKQAKWSHGLPSSPRSNSSPRPLEDMGNRNMPRPGNGAGDYECSHCSIAFRDCIMYTMHMGYHGYSDPFKCNMCGHQARDKVEFFLHIARAPHE